MPFGCIPGMRILAVALALLVVPGLSGCSDSPSPVRVPDLEVPSPEPLPPGNVVRSFWCGPPSDHVTPQRVAEIADAGFDLALPTCAGWLDSAANHRLLDAAYARGLRVMVGDQRMPTLHDWSPLLPKMKRTLTDDDRQTIAAIVADYGAHPALAGYYVDDQPSDADLDYVGAVMRELAAQDPKHPGFVNLWPMVPGSFPSEASYRSYLDHFVTAAGPDVLCYNRYTFRTSGDGDFFGNLALVRKAAFAHGLPFWTVLQSTPHDDYRPLTEAERRWEAMQALAYGSHGILYFTLWTPSGRSHDWQAGAIDRDGHRTEQYDHLRRINHDVAALGRYLIHADSLVAFQNPNEPLPAGGTAGSSDASVRFPGAGRVTAGVFHMPDGISVARDYVLFANLDYSAPTSFAADLHLGGGPHVQRLDPATGLWVDLATVPTAAGGSRILLTLEPGDGQLVRQW